MVLLSIMRLEKSPLNGVAEVISVLLFLIKAMYKCNCYRDLDLSLMQRLEGLLADILIEINLNFG